LPPKVDKSREIPTKFDLTAVQGHPRSSILVSVESPCTTSYKSFIVTLAELRRFGERRLGKLFFGRQTIGRQPRTVRRQQIVRLGDIVQTVWRNM